MVSWVKFDFFEKHQLVTHIYRNILSNRNWKITHIYFLDYIRTELLISTLVIDDQFFENIVAKTGNKKETIETLFQKIEIIQSQKNPLYQVSKEQLIGLNNLIEEFKRKYEAQ